MAILTIALAIGANTAMFSVVRALFLQPLGFPDEARLVEIRDCNQALKRQLEDGDRTSSSFDSRGCITTSGALYRDFLTQAKSYEVLGAMDWGTELVPLTGSGDPTLVRGHRVTRSFLEALGVHPLLGRWFDGDGEIVLNYGLWKDRFGGDPTIIGRKVLVRDTPQRVAGVMPAGFHYPPGTQMWLPHPFGTPAYQSEYSSRNLNLIGRLRRGVSLPMAQAEADALATRAATIDPEANRGWTAHVDGLLEEMTFAHRLRFSLLSAAVAIVLLIACANLVSLFLAGLETRSAEMAIRVALGAGRRHLFRQILRETLGLSLAGGALGLLLVPWSLDALRPLIPPDIPRAENIHVDLAVALFSMGASLLTGFVLAILPSFRASQANLDAALRPGVGRTTTRAGQFTRNLLIGVQVALAVILLAAAGLLFDTMRRLSEQQLGFNSAQLLVTNAPLSGSRFAEPGRRAAFAANLFGELSRQPGVVAVGGGYPLPFTGDQQGRTGVIFEGRGELDLGVVQYRTVTPDLFRALSIPLLAGRSFETSDRASAPGVCIVNRTLARRAFQTENPVGRKLRIDEHKPWLEVVGVVADVRQLGLDREPGPEVYLPWDQAPMGRITIAMRYQGAKAAAIAALRASVRRVDAAEPLGEISTMDALIFRSTSDRRFPLLLFSTLSALSLLMSSVGIYGVVSHSVACRTQEMGIRFALGAARTDVLRLVIRQSLTPVALGIAAGVGLTLITNRYLVSLLYGVRPNDPLTLATSSAILLFVAVAAAFEPSMRACRVDPMDALRQA